MSSDNSYLKTVQLNNQSYQVEVLLMNTQVQIPIPTGIIVNLTIYDDIYSIFKSGMLTINSTSNVIDTFVFQQINELRERTSGITYAFNVDSRDMVHIKIKPVDESNAGTYPDSLWNMEYIFAIYDEEEVIDNRGAVKAKTFFLKEASEQALIEYNNHWSTTDTIIEKYSNRIVLSQVGNSARKAHTGDAIRNILKKVLPNSRGAPDWDRGKTKVFYTSGPQQSAFDDLEYLLDRHVSVDGDDPAILGTEGDGRFFLRSLENIYKGCYTGNGTLGPYVIDAYNTHIGEVSDGTVEIGSFRRAFGFTRQQTDNLEGLTNFSFLNAAGVDSSAELSTIAVHSYDKSNKQFNIDSKDNHIYNIRQRSQKLYANKMGGAAPEPVIPLNEDKLTNRVMSHNYSGGQTKLDRLNSGANRVLKQSFAYAPTISFDTEGSTNRQTARFIMMTSAYVDSDSSFAKLFIGEWLIAKVVHVFAFNENSYINSIACVKPHSSDKLDRPEWADHYSSHYDFLQSQLDFGERIA